MIRRRSVNGIAVDEAFTRNLVWEPTHALHASDIGRSDRDYTQITAAEAEAFVQRVTAKLGRYITEPSPGVPLRINIDDATAHEGPSYHYRGEPFSGSLLRIDDTGAVIEMIPVRDGVVHGIVREWFPDSTQRSQTTMRDGVPAGTAYTWHPNGQLAEAREFDDDGHVVRTRQWTENGRVLRFPL
ncbi:toxin-antitoxin system YwqK family antitoxin [Phytohabitans rumicis]|uniref:toxin-antitoxin system YwqK family antitoxin n=1 Tax=Phytohabitans rumicis TaxID=1076125 RepID=UPI0015652B5C|nr:hypothetical protein [Phytohabitans rumicis]